MSKASEAAAVHLVGLIVAFRDNFPILNPGELLDACAEGILRTQGRTPDAANVVLLYRQRVKDLVERHAKATNEERAAQRRTAREILAKPLASRLPCDARALGADVVACCPGCSSIGVVHTCNPK